MPHPNLICSKRYDTRTRKDRVQRRVNTWKLQIPQLAIKYLEWKEHGVEQLQFEAPWDIEVINFGSKWYIRSVETSSYFLHQTEAVANSSTPPMSCS
jgi:hypothetical protein